MNLNTIETDRLSITIRKCWKKPHCHQQWSFRGFMLMIQACVETVLHNRT